MQATNKNIFALICVRMVLEIQTINKEVKLIKVDINFLRTK